MDKPCVCYYQNSGTTLQLSAESHFSAHIIYNIIKIYSASYKRRAVMTSRLVRVTRSDVV